MLGKIIKITFKTGKLYLFFVFIAVFLSLFSYILGNNIVLSVKDYLQDQIKPIVGGDIVLNGKNDLKSANDLDKYLKDFEIAKTISLNSTIFDNEKNPSLVELVFHTKNFPFYNQFEYETINNSGKIFVNQNIYDKYGENIEILGVKYQVKGIIKKSPIGDISIYTSQNTIYLPIENIKKELNSSNSRLEYKFFLKYKNNSQKDLLSIIKNDSNLKEFSIKTLQDRNENISDITDRFYVFINFFNLVVFVLTFFVVILSLETFFKKIKPIIGLLNIFGLKKIKIFYYNFLVLFGVFFISFLLAYLANILFMEILSIKYSFFSSKIESFYRGFFISCILLIVGIFSPIYKIFKSDVLSMLKDNSNFSNFGIIQYFIYLGLIFSGFLCINLISGINFYNSFLYSCGFISFIIIFYVLIENVLMGIYQIFKKFYKKNFYIFDSIRSTIKPGNVSFLIIFSSIISFLSIFVFYVFSGSFLNYLNNITNNSNDTFVINVQGKSLPTIKQYFSDEEIYEIVTLKIKKINNKTLEEYLKTPKVGREFGREFFSTTKLLENKIISGEKLASGGVSVDVEFAKSLGLKLGDEIVFGVAGLEKTLKVQNFREALRNGTNPFFYFMLDKSDFEKFPKNYILSYKEITKPENIEKELSKKVGNYLTFIKTKEIISIVISITNKILVVVYICLAYILIFSFLSFLVSISFLSTFKTQKIKLLNILGGNLKKLFGALQFEFGYLIFVGFIFSILFGSVLLFVLFLFIKYFSLYFNSYFIGIFVLILIFLFMNLYLKFLKKFN